MRLKMPESVKKRLLMERDGECVFCKLKYDDSPMKKYAPSEYRTHTDERTGLAYNCCDWHYALMKRWQSPEKRQEMEQILARYLDAGAKH